MKAQCWKKSLLFFPVFIFFAYSGLFVFASPSSPVVFEVQHQDLTTAEKQDYTWQWIKSELRNRYTYLDFHPNWKSLLDTVHSDDYNKKGSELKQEDKNLLGVIFHYTKTKDKTGALMFLSGTISSFLRIQKKRWNSLVDTSVGQDQDALLNPEYAYLTKSPISIKVLGVAETKKVSLEPLFLAAKRFGVLKTEEEFSKVKIPGFREIIWDFCFLSPSVNESDINATFLAVDGENKPKLNNLWTGIKNELKKPDYAHLVKTPILINNKNYDLEPLFKVTHSSFAGNGYDLDLATKMQLQDLVNANINGEKFKVALTAINNQKLDELWTQLKKILNQPEFSKWKDTLIKIKNKSYDLELLFTAKEKTDVKGSALPLDAKLKLQELLNDQITSKMIENQLLALNQAETEKNKQQTKEKQQSQALTIGLATGGGVLVAAGLGGFLYWFFKIRK